MTTTELRITKEDREQAKALGVQAGVVAQLRAEHGRGNVAKMLGLGESAKPTPAQPEADSKAFVPLKVLRRCPNPTWVFCQSPPPATAVQVRVRKNSRLRPGMLLQCRQSGKEWKCVHAGFAPV